MQLLNYTQIPTEVLRPILAEAAKRVAAKTRGVLVTVNWGHAYHTTGHAHCYDGWWERRLPRTRKYRRYDHQGAIVLTIGRRIADALSWAEGMYETALHEWAHIADWQAGSLNIDSQHYRRERRRPHAQRDHEEYAKGLVHSARENPRATEAEQLLGLAVWGEEYINTLTSKRLARAKRERDKDQL